MPYFGSDRGVLANSIGGIADDSGNALVSTATTFGASPLGAAARAQAIFGIANAQFNLLPPDPTAPIYDNLNPLPFWSVLDNSGGRITATSTFDTTTGTWAVQVDPTAGTATDSITLTTRSYVLTDDNLALRQRAFLTMSKSTAYAGATQFNVTMTATYYDSNATIIGTAYTIGTALDNSALTTINGFTMAGSAAIASGASFVDIAITLACTASVTSGVKVNLKSLVISTTSPTTGSTVITEKFNASTTWTRPTGVTQLLGLVAVGAGGGGASGSVRCGGRYQQNGTGGYLHSATGGASGAMAYIKNLYVGGDATISIGVGVGGAGGTAVSVNRGTIAAGSVAQEDSVAGVAGAVGGDTSFGTYITVPGGGGGSFCAVSKDPAVPGRPSGANYTAGSTLILDGVGVSGGTAAVAGSCSTVSGGLNYCYIDGLPGTPTFGGTFSVVPFQTTYWGAGGAGGAGTIVTSGVAGTSYLGTAGTAAFTAQRFNYGGAASSPIATQWQAGSPSPKNVPVVASGNGDYGAGGAGASNVFTFGSGTAFGTYTVVGGNGGSAAANSGAGGAAGGHAYLMNNANAGPGTAFVRGVMAGTSGAGGAGGDGYVIIAYVA